MVLRGKTQAVVLFPARDFGLDGLELPLKPKHTTAVKRDRFAFPVGHGSTQGVPATSAFFSEQRTNAWQLAGRYVAPRLVFLFVPSS
jgi:hypothetical protein